MYKFYEYTKPDIDYFINNCNFTDEELAVFLKRCKDESNQKIALDLNMSTAKVSKLIKRIKNKILKV